MVSVEDYLAEDERSEIKQKYRRIPPRGFTGEYNGGSVTIPLPEIGTELSLDETYEGVDFT